MHTTWLFLSHCIESTKIHLHGRSEEAFSNVLLKRIICSHCIQVWPAWTLLFKLVKGCRKSSILRNKKSKWETENSWPPIDTQSLLAICSKLYIFCQHLVEYYFRLILQPCTLHSPYLILCPVEEKTYVCLKSGFTVSGDTLLKKPLGTEATFPLL